jgi:hypothetical protein
MSTSHGSGDGSSRATSTLTCGVSSTSGIQCVRASASNQRNGSVPMFPFPSNV